MLWSLMLVLLLSVSCSSAFKVAHRMPLTVARCGSPLYVVQQQPAERERENVFQELLRAFMESLPWTLVRYLHSFHITRQLPS